MIALLWGIIICIQAQECKPFEGEITFETYENYSDSYKKKMGSMSIYFDGVHQCRLILKGEKMHFIDETTKCHTIANDSIISMVFKGEKAGNYGYVHFCELTKTGLNLTNNVHYAFFCHKTKDSDVLRNELNPITAYAFEKTTSKDTILESDCTLYTGIVTRSLKVMTTKIHSTLHIQAYLSNIVAPRSYAWYMEGLEIPNITMKWAYKFDGGHMEDRGEISLYKEAIVTQIQQRPVSDEEFATPSDYTIIEHDNTKPQRIMMYYNGIKQELERHGIKSVGRKDSMDVHYKTDGTWDF